MTKNQKVKGRKAMAQAKEETADPNETELVLTKDEIKFEDFDKVELKVAKVLAVAKVEGADKLLQFTLDAGDKGPRQILSGIAQWYPNPAELVGKNVIAVTNLKPRKMRGQISQGMLLSAEYGETVQLITVPENIPAGSIVG